MDQYDNNNYRGFLEDVFELDDLAEIERLLCGDNDPRMRDTIISGSTESESYRVDSLDEEKGRLVDVHNNTYVAFSAQSRPLLLEITQQVIRHRTGGEDYEAHMHRQYVMSKDD